MKNISLLIPCILFLVMHSTGLSQPLQDNNVVEIGSFETSSYAQDVIVRDNIAYVAANRGLEIVDLHDIENPNYMSFLEVQQRATKVVLSGSFAYVIHLNTGLYSVDISDPENPTIVDFIELPGENQTMRVYENYLLITCYRGGLDIIDISDPTDLREAGRLGMQYNQGMRNIEVVGHYALIVQSGGRLLSVDISEPQHLQIVDNLLLRGSSQDIEFSEPYAYVTSDRYIEVIDVSDPENMVVISEYQDDDFLGTLELCGEFLVTGVSEGFKVFNKSEPETLVECGSYCLERGVYGVCISDNLIFVASERDGVRYFQFDENAPSIFTSEISVYFGMVVPDTRTELTVTLSNHGFTDLGINSIYTSDNRFRVDNQAINLAPREEIEIPVSFEPHNRGMYDERMYIESNDPDGVLELQLMAGVSNIRQVEICDVGYHMNDLDLTGDYVYGIGGGYEIVFSIFDISDPESVEMTHFDGLDDFCHSHIELVCIATTENFAFIGAYAVNVEYFVFCGVTSWDLSHPENPAFISSYEMAVPFDIVIRDDLAYVLTEAEGLSIVDVSSPQDMEQIGRCDFYVSYQGGITLAGDYAFAASVNLDIIDISDPENPECCGRIQGDARNVVVNGDLAYVVGQNTGLRIFDITNPEEPELISELETLGQIGSIQLLDNQLFIADGSLMVVDVSDPEAPVEVDFHYEFGKGVISGDMAYTMYIGNLKIFDISERNRIRDSESEQMIHLAEGWNLISLNRTPPAEFWIRQEGPDILRMTEQFRIADDQHHLLQMKDDDGLFYAPAWEFNSIPYWDLTKGYLVKIDQNMDAVWPGVTIPPDTEIPLTEGWNAIAYYPQYDLDASAPDFYVLSPIIENVLIAKDVDGGFMTPEWDFSNMNPWTTGQGYMVKIDENVELVFRYPSLRQENEQVQYKRDLSMSLYGIENTGVNMSLLVNSIQDLPEGGDYTLVAVSSSGVIYGAGEVIDGRCGLAVWGDDVLTEEKDGLLESEPFHLELRDEEKALSFDLKVIEQFNVNSLIFRANNFVALTVSTGCGIPESFSLCQNFPNPFNSSTMITFTLPTQSPVTLSVYDTNGRLVDVLLDRVTPAGMQSVVWDGSGLAAGVYVVKMSSKSNNLITFQKAVLLR